MFFFNFEISKTMTSWRPFCTILLEHSHGRNFAPIFIKIWGKVERCHPLFFYLKSAKWDGNFCQYVGPYFRKKTFKMAAKKVFFLNKASEMFISTKIDLLITNLIIFSQLNVSFPVKVEKYVKILKKVKWLNISTLPWAIFLLISMICKFAMNNGFV